MYDPTICRFATMDPIDYPAMSSYVYAASNPLRYKDPDGRAPEDVTKMVGFHLNRESGNVRAVYQTPQGYLELSGRLTRLRSGWIVDGFDVTPVELQEKLTGFVSGRFIKTRGLDFEGENAIKYVSVLSCPFFS